MDMLNARKEKLEQLKKLMMEMMALEGLSMDSSISMSKIDSLLEDSNEDDDEMEDDDEEESMGETEEVVAELDDDGTPTLAAMKKQFFKPRSAPVKEAPSAMIIADMQETKDVPDMKREIEKAMPARAPMSGGKSWLKKGKYA